MAIVLAFFIISLVALMLLSAVQSFCTFRDTRRLPAPGKLLSIPGGTLHVHEQGSGDPPIVLEAGISASSLSWSNLQPRLAAFTTVYSYDRPGLGWSSASPGHRSLRAIVADLDAWLSASGVHTPFILVAHSFGAYIARYYARSFPNKVAGLILVDPLTPEEWCRPTQQQMRTLRGGVFYSRIGGILATFGIVRLCLWLLQRGNLQAPGRLLRTFGTRADSTVRRLLGEVSKFPPEALPSIRAHWSAGRSFWTMARYLQSLPACAIEMEACSSIPPKIPVTVISGSHQPPERLAEHEALARHSACGKHIVASRSGHWVHLDEPELLVEIASEMLCTVSAQKL